MSDPVRVLHVIASLAPVHGGTTSAVVQMVEGLAALGIRCEIASSDDDGPGRRLSPGAPERRFPNRHYFAKQAELWTWSPEFRPWLEDHVRNYDLVHIHGLFSHVNGVAGQVSRRAGVPYIVTPHGMANRYGLRHKFVRKKLSLALVERPLLEGAAMIHMTTRSEEREFADLRISTPVVRIPLAIRGVLQGNAKRFRARQPETKSRPLAVFVGRINPIKNLEAAIDALATVEGRDWHLVVCGDGPFEYASTLEMRSIERGVAERVSWLGFIGEQDKADVFAASDVYLQPSLSESFGMAAVEAVSAGLPCVLGERVAIAEDLARVGLAVAVMPTAEGIAKGLHAAIQVRNREPGFADRARNFVKERFSSGKISGELAEAYATAHSGVRFSG